MHSPNKWNLNDVAQVDIIDKTIAALLTVARIKPVGMQVIGDEIRYDSEITFIYRSVKSLKILSREFIYTPVEDNNPGCTCPRLAIDREYIIFGNYELDDDLLKLFVTKQSIVRTYTLKHMYQLTRLQHRLNC